MDRHGERSEPVRRQTIHYLQHLLQDRNGDIWIATQCGLVRYRPRKRPPSARVEDVVAGEHLGEVEEVELPVTQKLLAFELTGRSWTTHPDSSVVIA